MNKTAIVTGASGNGLGRSITLTLAREGANVVINYKNSNNKAEEIVQYIRSNNGCQIQKFFHEIKKYIFTNIKVNWRILRLNASLIQNIRLNLTGNV